MKIAILHHKNWSYLHFCLNSLLWMLYIVIYVFIHINIVLVSKILKPKILGEMADFQTGAEKVEDMSCPKLKKL